MNESHKYIKHPRKVSGILRPVVCTHLYIGDAHLIKGDRERWKERGIEEQTKAVVCHKNLQSEFS